MRTVLQYIDCHDKYMYLGDHDNKGLALIIRK